MNHKTRPQFATVRGVPVVVETCHALPLVNLTLARTTGAVIDPVGQEGLTRLLSRLTRRTAGGRPLQTIEETLDRLGGSMGADVSYSAASMSGTVIARSLVPFVELFADALGKPSLDVTEFERLKRETSAEIIEGQDNDRALAHRALRRAIYPDHPYGRTATGTLQSVARIDHASLVAQDRVVRRRNSLLLGMSGSIELGEAIDVAERLLDAVPEGAAPVDASGDPCVPVGRKLVIVDKPERSQTQILVGLAGTKPDDPDHSALHVAMTVFGGTFSSRLMQAVRVERGWSYGAYASLPIDRFRQAMTIWTFPSKQDAPACARLTLELLERLIAEGITAKELGFAKNSLIRSHAFSIDTAAKRMSLALDAALLGLPVDFYERYEERIASVTLEQANLALQARLDPGRLVIAVVGNARELRERLLESVPGITGVDVVPFDSGEL